VILQPQTLTEWQDAADAAEAALCFHSARLYGLIDGGPTVNADRCAELLIGARDRGIQPRPDALERCMRAWMAVSRPAVLEAAPIKPEKRKVRA
jgi:hypothetical protein